MCIADYLDFSAPGAPRPQPTFTQLHDEFMAITGRCPAPGDCLVCAERRDERTQVLCMVRDGV